MNHRAMNSITILHIKDITMTPTIPTPTTIHCMYCNHSWAYKGSNLSNICCPRCKNRFDVTQGKAKRYNDMANELIQLKTSMRDNGGNNTKKP